MAHFTDTLTIDKMALARMEPEQLYALLCSLQTVDEVLSGLLAFPRCSAANGGFNSAGRVLADLSDWLSAAKESLVVAARSRSVRQTKANAAWLGWVKVRYEADYIESFTALNVIVAQAANAEEEADA